MLLLIHCHLVLAPDSALFFLFRLFVFLLLFYRHFYHLSLPAANHHSLLLYFAAGPCYSAVFATILVLLSIYALFLLLSVCFLYLFIWGYCLLCLYFVFISLFLDA